MHNLFEIENFKKLCNEYFKNTIEKINGLILKIFKKQLEETNVKNSLNNNLLISSILKQIDFYKFCKEEIFNHRVNNLLEKIEDHGFIISKIENYPSPER